MSLGTWGDLVFEVSSDRMRTWQSKSRSGEARYADHEVHLAKPVAEFLGPSLDSFTVSMRFDAERGVNPEDELAKLRKARDTGQVETLVIGGAPVFDCTLRGLNEDHRHHDKEGHILVAIAELTFKEYN